MGLAPVIVQEVFRTIRRLKAEGMTMLLVEQFALAALEVADHAYVLERGRVGSGFAAAREPVPWPHEPQEECAGHQGRYERRSTSMPGDPDHRLVHAGLLARREARFVIRRRDHRRSTRGGAPGQSSPR
jgi:energy-coupling factor transporter ATP-binding protein EcfA2